MSPPPLPSPAATTAEVGQGAFCYQAQLDWAQLPKGWSFVEVAGVATDSADNVFVFNRGEHPVIVFDREGRFLRSWGEGQFVRPHGITIGPDDAVYCVDDTDHTLRKYTPEGRLLLALGTSGQPSDTGARSVDYRQIVRSAGPFNFPTNVALAADGSLFIADGYGNARVHHFSADGQLIRSWGEPGAGPGQFHVPHGIAVDRAGTVWVADRENSRLQLFSAEGEFIDQWADMARPSQVVFDAAGNLFVPHLGYRAGMFPGNQPPAGDTRGGHVSVYDVSGKLQSRWGGGDNPQSAGDFYAPHDLCVDSRGDVYVGEVIVSASGGRGAERYHALQKFVRNPKREAR